MNLSVKIKYTKIYKSLNNFQSIAKYNQSIPKYYFVSHFFDIFFSNLSFPPNCGYTYCSAKLSR